MKTAIIFSSKHGTTAKVAEMLAEQLKLDEIKLFNLQHKNEVNLQEFEAVILGTAIYAGRPMKKTKRFIRRNLKTLKTKKIGLFICGMDPGKEKQAEEMRASFPDVLLNHATTKYYLGGEFIFEDLSFFERFIVKKVSKVNKSISLIHHENIKKFVKEFKGETN
ncbi:MAG: flavodoxin [Bacteroidales bacterium]|nr:flavodoxin [Bacteroidales bacterium]